MRLVRTVAIIAVALVMIGGALAYFNRGAVFFMVASMTGPSGTFVADQQAPAPDYANPANWAALPQTQDPADMTPEGVAARTAPAPADVFFIHPTGFIAARTVDVADGPELGHGRQHTLDDGQSGQRL
jgi:hypothetical protein